MDSIENRVHEFVRRDFHQAQRGPQAASPHDPVWAGLRTTGSRLWLDTGDIEIASGLWNDSFEALTTNNSLLNIEIQKGLYDHLVKDAAAELMKAAPGLGAEELVLEIAFVLNARHALELVRRFDAFVSVELHTDLAHDLERTVKYGLRIHAICPERFLVKVPLTVAGLLGSRALVRAGVPVNFTLGFSARQNYVAALLAGPDFVNVFMGRLNAYVKDHGLGSGEFVGEKATLAAQREILALRDAGRTGSKLIGASIRSGAQIAVLAGLDVMTMPPKAAAEYRQRAAAEVVPTLSFDPDIPIAPGVRLEDFYATSLWSVPEAVREGVCAILSRDLDRLSAPGLHEEFLNNGMRDMFPVWSDDDVATAMRDGKIPVHAKWKDRLANGQIGLDALMNLAALQSFVTDQRALDDRIRSLLG